MSREFSARCILFFGVADLFATCASLDCSFFLRFFIFFIVILCLKDLDTWFLKNVLVFVDVRLESTRGIHPLIFLLLFLQILFLDDRVLMQTVVQILLCVWVIPDWTWCFFDFLELGAIQIITLRVWYPRSWLLISLHE